jgi:hypothetical protein
MPSFDYLTILWGLPLVGLPVLIHLINMFRHKRIAWAAMEFLEISRKKNRTRILLKQLLLLLLRMAAIAAVVCMLAKPRMPNDWDGPLSGETLHYVVLLDDSYSMNEQREEGGETLFEEAKTVIETIAKKASEEGRPATLSIFPFSRMNPEADPISISDKTSQRLSEIDPDFLEIRVDDFFEESLQTKWKSLRCSQTSVSPENAVNGLRTLFADSPPRRRAVYIVSDFRQKDWEETDSLRDALFELQENGARYRLIACTESSRPNLSVTRLRPLSSVQVAGAPLVMEVEVANYGAREAGPVLVQILADDLPRRSVEIDTVPSGQNVTQSFSLTLPDEGEYRISARIEPDVVQDDNQRHRVVALESGSPVLLIDGDVSAQNARYVSAALAPQGVVDTGIRPRVESPLFLNNADLDDYRAVFLLDAPRLSITAVERIEEYLQKGGNVCVFLGPLTDPDHVNETWFRGGEGFFPVPLDGQNVLTPDGLNPAPDVLFKDHSAFGLFEGEGNPYASLLKVDRYISVSDSLYEQSSETLEVVASLRGNAPLICEHSYEEGRVLAFLTTASPQWNNWARGNPLFVIILQESYAYLLSNQQTIPNRLVGLPIDVSYDPDDYEEELTARFRSTEDQEEVTVVPPAPNDDAADARAYLQEIDRAGFYEVELVTHEGNSETRTFAVNVDPREGDLELINRESLDAHLQGVKYEFFDLMRFRGRSEENAGFDLSTPLLFLLMLILLGEQVLACSVSGPSRSRSKSQFLEPAEIIGRPAAPFTLERGRPSARKFLRGAAELPLRLIRIFETDRKGRTKR